MAVNSRGGNDAQNVEVAAGLFDLIYSQEESGVLVESAILNCFVDQGQALGDDAAGAYGDMADFGVAHFAKSQADFFFGGFDQKVGEVRPEVIKSGGPGRGDGVAFDSGGVAEAVDDGQDGEGNGHG